MVVPVPPTSITTGFDLYVELLVEAASLCFVKQIYEMASFSDQPNVIARK